MEWPWPLDKLVSYYRSRIGVADPIASTWSDWVWPLPVMHGRLPKVSDGMHLPGSKERGGCGHFGIDIMHGRQRGDNAIELIAPDGGKASHHVIFLGEPAIAAARGRVYSAESTGSGHTVKISHRVNGKPILSVYRHLQDTLVQKGDLVDAGTPLGRIGDNPSQAKDPPHLHFELWDTSANNQWLEDAYQKQVIEKGCPKSKGGDYLKWIFDPATVMSPWRAISWPDRTIIPFTGEKPKPGPGTSGGSDSGGPSGGRGLLAFVAAVGLGLGFGALRKGRKSYV